MYQREIAARIGAGLADTPVLLLAGPRQAGKSTLARLVAANWPGAALRFAGEAPPVSPKAYCSAFLNSVLLSSGKSDSGLYANLLGLAPNDTHIGVLWEAFVGVELLRLISFEPAQRYALLHFHC